MFDNPAAGGLEYQLGPREKREGKDKPAMQDFLKQKDIGTIISDDVSPSFDVFKFEAFAGEYISPGALVGTRLTESKFLIGRVSAGLEVSRGELSSDEAAAARRIYEVEVIEEGLLTAGEETPGIIMIEPSDMALAGAPVFIPSNAVMVEAMGFATDRENAICLGRTRITAEDALVGPGKSADNVLLKPEFLQRHLFIGGTTGTGKSYATGILIEEVARLGIPVVIVDSQREYTEVAKGLNGTVLKPGENYTTHLAALTDREIVGMVPTLQGTAMEDLLTQTFLKLKRERQDWNLNDLLREMAKDGPTLELPFATSAPAISRVEHQIGRHDFIGAATDWEGLLRDNPVVDIDCALLDQSQLQLIATATLRDLFDRRLKGTIPPYVIVLEEAHLLVPEVEDSPCKQVIRENVRIGRHYGICVVLITQSPVDIDKKTIRQCNTRLIFALEPDQLDALQGVRSDATEDMLRRLPKMPLGTCLLSGTYQTIKHAIPVRIRSDRRTVAAGATPDILAEVEEKKEQ